MAAFRPSPALYPFDDKWFESSVGRMHYVDEGTGLSVLFLHGNPTWSFLYRRIIIELRERFRCVAVDHLGFGLSERPAGFGYTPAEHAQVLREFVDHLDLRDFVVMGQDWGGPIGTSVASSMPERVSGLILGNTWFWPIDRLSTKVFSRVMSSSLMQRRITEKNYFVERLIPLATDRKLTPEEMEHYRGVQPTPEARVGVARFPRELLASHSWLAEVERSVRNHLASKPVLLVWGMRDVAFSPKTHLPRMRSTFPNAVLVELPRAKHFIQEDAPSEIARAIAERFG
jgi:haloalkane dehalogenase